MSKIKVPLPTHIPSFTRWAIQRYYLAKYLESEGITPLLKDMGFVFDNYYYYTTLEGWGKILYNLVFSSDLYKKDIFDCEDFSLKAYLTCCERYEMNTLLTCIGKVKEAYHGFNIFPYGNSKGIEGILLWEPNEGFAFSGSAFEIGEYGYKPELILI